MYGLGATPTVQSWLAPKAKIGGVTNNSNLPTQGDVIMNRLKAWSTGRPVTAVPVLKAAPTPKPPVTSPQSPSGTSPTNPPVIAVDTSSAAGGGSTYSPVPVSQVPISQSASPSGGGTQTTDGVETDMELQEAGMFGGSLMPLLLGGAVLFALSKMKGR